MQSVSSTYTQIMENGGWQEVKLVIDNAEYGMSDELVEMWTSHSLYDSAVSVGNTVAGTIEIRLIAESSSIPTMAKLRPYVRATDGTNTSEWLPRGVFWIDTRQYDKETGILTLTGLDAMLMGEQDYCTYGNQGTWPQIDLNVLCDIADRLDLGTDAYTAVSNPTGNPKSQGWYYKSGNNYYLTSNTSVQAGTTYYVRSNSGIDSRTLPLIANHYQVGYPGIGEGAYTVREVLGYIGSMYAGNWTLNEDGKLRLIVIGDLPAETNYFIDEGGNTITLGGDRLVFV